jgi:ABC-type branched-subunit amino acid transport system permease subunit
VEQLVLASPPLSGGPAGSSAPRPNLFGLDVGISARGADNFRPVFGLMVLVVLVTCCVAVANLRRNGTGMRWLAVRANERAAAAAGIDVGRAKLTAFATSSFLAGLAGVLMAESTATLSPTSFMVIGALVVLAMTYLGGVASIGGALVAGLLAQAGLVTTLSAELSGGDVDRYVFATSGIALILTAIFAPDGITGLLRRRPRRTADAVSGSGTDSGTGTGTDGRPTPAPLEAASTGTSTRPGAGSDDGLDRPAGAPA